MEMRPLLVAYHGRLTLLQMLPLCLSDVLSHIKSIYRLFFAYHDASYFPCFYSSDNESFCITAANATGLHATAESRISPMNFTAKLSTRAMVADVTMVARNVIELTKESCDAIPPMKAVAVVAWWIIENTQVNLRSVLVEV